MASFALLQLYDIHMHWVFGICILVVMVVAMEAFAWCMHKYVLHGPLWFLHQTHHKPQAGFFEANDIVSLFYGILSAALIVYGDTTPTVIGFVAFWGGVGIAVYGVLYFFLHDVVIHQRVRFRYRFRNGYLLRLIRAHKKHHKHLSRTSSEAFGFLYAAPRYEVEHRQNAR